MWDNGEIESETKEESDCESITDLKDASDVEYPEGGNILITWRALNTHVKKKVGDRMQREIIFHTRCLIQDKTCNVIVDGGSCVNVASITLIEKLRLLTLKHPRPYNLQWLNNSGQVKVTR